MVRVFLSCVDVQLCEKLRELFKDEGALAVCETAGGIDALKNVLELVPDLVIVELRPRMPDELDIVEAIKTVLPNTPLFIVSDDDTIETEREALARGVDAVFEKNGLDSLMQNARAVLSRDRFP